MNVIVRIAAVAPLVARLGGALAADMGPEEAVICQSGDASCVKQARRDLLREIRARFGHYVGGDSGGPVDMFLRRSPQWDCKANELIVRSIQERLNIRQKAWAKGQPWNGELYPMDQEYLEVYYRFPDRLTPEAKAAIRDIYSQALFTDAEAVQRGARSDPRGCWHWSHVHAYVGANWGLVAAHVCILGGQIAGRPDFVAEGKKGLEEWFDYAAQRGMVSAECNLMEGHWTIYSFDLVPIAEWAGDPSTRRLARLLLERVWLEKLLYFHAPTRRECGAAGRCVVQGKGEPIIDTNQRLFLATQLDQPLPYAPPPDPKDKEQRNSTIHAMEPYLVSGWRIPAYLQDLAFRRQLPQVLQSRNGQACTPHPWTFPSGWQPLFPDPKRDLMQPNELYSYLTGTFALGTMSQGWGNTGTPALAFWKAHPGLSRSVSDHRALYTRYQHNDRKPFGRPVAFINGKETELLPHACWAEFGRHAAMQDKGLAIVVYRPRLDNLMTYGKAAGVGQFGFVTFDKEVEVTSMQALACFYRENPTPKGFCVGREPVASFPATVGRGQWVFVDDGETWTAVYPLPATDLGGAQPPRLVAGKEHVFLQVDNWRPSAKAHPDPAKLLNCGSGFLIAVGDRTDYASFADFQKALLASKIADECKGTVQTVAWSVSDRTLRMSWDAYEEKYLERSVNGATQDPWPGFACPEYVQALSRARLGDVTATTYEYLPVPVWLLADRPAHTYVAWQPTPGKVTPLALDTSLGKVSTPNFPFGKLVFRQVAASGGQASLRIEIDADYPTTPNPAMSLQVTPAGLPLEAVVNGRQVLVHKADGGHAWKLEPFDTLGERNK